jgi:hypothetical protein
VNCSRRCPKGNRQMRRVLNQAAERRGQSQRHVLRDRVSTTCPATRARPSHRRNRPPAVSSDLEDPPRRHSVRRTRASHQRRSEEGGGAQDDPGIAKSRLPRRTAFGSIGQPGMIASDFRPDRQTGVAHQRSHRGHPRWSRRQQAGDHGYTGGRFTLAGLQEPGFLDPRGRQRLLRRDKGCHAKRRTLTCPPLPFSFVIDPLRSATAAAGARWSRLELIRETAPYRRRSTTENRSVAGGRPHESAYRRRRSPRSDG